ncbi:trypsin-like peptidase domain-containing protein [Candidatus Saccharibacteria bacterium]|nr:trypsin-like peptidase domain-containing protein [Candidatus Saccharibacteria bacterium]
MENIEEGKISEVPKQDTAVVVEQPKEAREPRARNTFATFLATIAVLLGAGGLTFGVLAYTEAHKPLTVLSSGTDGNSANFTEGSIADVVSKVSDSVVSIVTSTTSHNYWGQAYESGAAGTGVVVSADGYVLTNKHVIDGANSITIVMHDGTTYENATVAATDPLNDIAFVKISDVSDLKAATLGDSKTITAGQQVVAIGNALGQYQNSVTSGIISGTGRSLTATDNSGSMSEQLSDMIQTDAAINSGNSGGPLINAAGEVIGINTATSASGENVGFAIPIASVKGMLSQLVSSGKAERAYVGVYSVDITPDYAKKYNLPVTTGTYIYSSQSYSAILSGSPAAKAGLHDKDIITAVNGVKIGSAGSLSTLIGEYKPGDTVSLTIIRDGKEMGIKVELAGYQSTK